MTAQIAQHDDDEPEEQARLDPARLLVSTVLAIGGLVAVVAAVGYFAREPLLRASQAFVDQLGGLGVAIGYFLPDALTVPLPNDVVTVLGIAGGMGFWEVVAWGTAGSLVGGCVGYGIGRFLGSRRIVRRFFKGRGARMHELLRRYGVVAVGVAALTPIPYSLGCWAAGSVRLPFWQFLLVSLLRFVRVAGYLYLIELGLPLGGG